MWWLKSCGMGGEPVVVYVIMKLRRNCGIYPHLNVFGQVFGTSVSTGLPTRSNGWVDAP